MHLKRFRGETVRDALALARAELGPRGARAVDAAGPGPWLARSGRRSRGRSDRRRGARGVGSPARPAGSPTARAGDGQRPAPPRLEAAGFPGRRRPGGQAGPAAEAVARRDRRRHPAARVARLGRALRGGGRRLRRDRGVRRPAWRRQDHDHREDCRAGTCPSRRPAAPGVGRRLQGRRGRAAAALRRHHRRAVRRRADGRGSRRALASATGPVLVDTAGRSPRDGTAHDVLSVLRGARGVRTHLVVPAGSLRARRRADDPPPLRRAARPADPDQGRRGGVRGGTGGGAARSGVQVSYLGTGQRVPDDLLRATPPHLAAALLGDRVAESAA